MTIKGWCLGNNTRCLALYGSSAFSSLPLYLYILLSRKRPNCFLHISINLSLISDICATVTHRDSAIYIILNMGIQPLSSFWSYHNKYAVICNSLLSLLQSSGLIIHTWQISWVIRRCSYVSLDCVSFNSLKHASGMSGSSTYFHSMVKSTSQLGPCFHGTFPLSSKGITPLDGMYICRVFSLRAVQWVSASLFHWPSSEQFLFQTSNPV